MVSNCFTCGRGFNGTEHETLVMFKKIYEQYGVDRYFYKLSENSEVMICKKADFKRIFIEQIKPNLINGAEYSHISEYSPKT